MKYLCYDSEDLRDSDDFSEIDTVEDFFGEIENEEDYSIDEYVDYLLWIEYFDFSFKEEDFPYVPAFHDPIYDKRCWARHTKLCTEPYNFGNCCVYCTCCPDYKDCIRGCSD